jgi:DNA transformation protein
MVERFEQGILRGLAALGEVTSRPLFGGHGLYWGQTIFAIVFGDKLYLKVDEKSKGDYLARGMGPFQPNERQTIKSYYEVPPEVLADPDSLLS